jgi:hypothetical protein
VTNWPKDKDGYSHPINDNEIDNLIIVTRNKLMGLQYHFKKCIEHVDEILNVIKKIDKIQNTEKGD